MIVRENCLVSVTLMFEWKPRADWTNEKFAEASGG
jgi:hypothetical protein